MLLGLTTMTNGFRSLVEAPLLPVVAGVMFLHQASSRVHHHHHLTRTRHSNWAAFLQQLPQQLPQQQVKQEQVKQEKQDPDY